MSRIGKKPISIPEKVSVTIEPDKISVKGPKGELSHFLHAHVAVKQEGNELIVSIKNKEDKFDRSLWGTFTSVISSMIDGVTQGFSKQLEINGVGYEWQVQGQKVMMKVGLSHPVEYTLPEGIDGKAAKNVLTISGADKQLVGSVAAEIRAVRKPEPYKGKGVKYIDEVIRRKAGKQAAGTEGEAGA